MTKQKILGRAPSGCAVPGVLTWVLSSLLTLGCSDQSTPTGTVSTPMEAVPASPRLPYDIYLSGTFTDWTQVPKNQFVLDEATGIYHLNNVRAGLTADGNLRRFKITGAHWNHQFGIGPNDETTPRAQTTLVFEQHTAQATLRAFPAIKDIYLPLVGDQDGSSAEQLVDFRLQVLDAAATELALEVHLDNPPLTSTLLLRRADQTLIELPYVGDGLYRAGIVLAKGDNEFTLQDERQQYWGAGTISANSPGELAPCTEACTVIAHAEADNAYEISVVSVPAPSGADHQEATLSISLRVLSAEEAQAATPHFGADGAVLSTAYAPYPLDKSGKTETVQVSVTDRTAELRTFALTSTQFQRDEKPKWRRVTEVDTLPRVNTGNVLFDALFAMAVDDMQQDSVDEIRDGNYNVGAAIPCACFETGEKWNYVWTRDLSYAAHLALGYLDTPRVVNSLLFKTSGFRAGVSAPLAVPADTTQIIQDTGSGGSWPVSTDRVSWSAAAETVLDSLHGDARADFAKKAYAALRGTVEADRVAAYDPQVGLYGGEQSYLDWRTQTYAPWITNNLAHMAASKALSTNVMHYQALRLTARLAREYRALALAEKYEGWAENLKHQINQTLWLDEQGLYASMTTAAEDPAPLQQYDMLGSALAIVYGVASPQQAARIMANYPHAPYGVPVYYPQQPNVYVYHNRSVWPFVTGYALRAAKQIHHVQAANHAIQSLMRGAALNLSNMENFEWLTLKPWYDDGPAINSRRQLWSVGAYLGMTLETVFGYQVTADGVRIAPFLTSALRQQLGEQAILHNLTYQHKQISIRLHLPEQTEADVNGYYPVASVSLNGAPVTGHISAAMLMDAVNTIEVRFGEAVKDSQTLTLVPEVDPLSHTAPAVYAPTVPVLDSIKLVDDKFVVQFSDAANPAVAKVRYNIYHNGQQVVNNHEGLVWQDTRTARADVRHCFAVQAVFVESGNQSLHSEPHCYEAEAVQIIPVTDARVASNISVTPASATLAKPSLLEWGKPTDSLHIKPITIDQAGHYAWQFIYNNRQSTIDSGVTAALKVMKITDTKGKEVATGVVVMPNVEDRDGAYPLRASTAVVTHLEQGDYQLSLHDFFNMSYLASNQTYAGSGGKTGPVNTASITELKIARLDVTSDAQQKK